MLYISGKEATRIQNMTHSLYHECLDLLVTIDEYNKCIDLESNYIDDILDKGRLVSVLFSCMRYKIIVGISSILDKNKKCLSIYKLLNVYEQSGIKKLNNEIKKAKDELQKYEELRENIKKLRDKVFAHVEIEYAIETEDIFDMDVDFFNEQVNNSIRLLKYIMKLCEILSVNYDDDTLNIKLLNSFNLNEVK